MLMDLVRSLGIFSITVYGISSVHQKFLYKDKALALLANKVRKARFLPITKLEARRLDGSVG